MAMAVEHGPLMAGIGRLGLLFDVLGAAVIMGGVVVTLVRAITVGRIAGGKAAYLVARRTFGKGLLLGLEVLIAADLMRTVSVNLTLPSIAALGLLVVVRTILSFSIQVEMEGDLPWRVGRRHRQSSPS